MLILLDHLKSKLRNLKFNFNGKIDQPKILLYPYASFLTILLLHNVTACYPAGSGIVTIFEKTFLDPFF